MSATTVDERMDEGAFRIEAPKVKHFVQSIHLNVHHFYVFGEIEDDIHKYFDLLNILKTANEEDTIIIYINSEGGSLRMAIQIVNSMMASRAKVITSLDGDAHSAATMIFMAGSEYVINPNCSFMIHNYSGGFIGKGHEVRTRIDHVNDYVGKMMKSYYEKILTEKEIEDVIDGRDIWMDSEELIRRLDMSEAIHEPDEVIPNSVKSSIEPKPTKKKKATKVKNKKKKKNNTEKA